EHFRQQASLMPCSVPLLWQHTLADFIRDGHFWRHLKKMRQHYAQRRLWIEEALAEQGFVVTLQKGGIQLVIEVEGEFNEHKKLITFSDSVQDAAHRASFFTARTWPLMVRGQIASVLGEKETLPLDAFAARVCQQTRERSPDDAHFAASFIAPNMQWMN
ncbi:Helicase Type III restriction, partial [Salmonella enterica subsp. enterica serovar Heidelberg str. 76-0300]